MEDAQRLWQLEKARMQETITKQKDEMVEDKQWLEKEEKLLVGMKITFTLTYETIHTSHRSLLFFGMHDTYTLTDFYALFKDPKINESKVVVMVGGFQSIPIFILWHIQFLHMKSDVNASVLFWDMWSLWLLQ